MFDSREMAQDIKWVHIESLLSNDAKFGAVSLVTREDQVCFRQKSIVYEH